MSSICLNNAWQIYYRRLNRFSATVTILLEDTDNLIIRYVTIPTFFAADHATEKSVIWSPQIFGSNKRLSNMLNIRWGEKSGVFKSGAEVWLGSSSLRLKLRQILSHEAMETSLCLRLEVSSSVCQNSLLSCWRSEAGSVPFCSIFSMEESRPFVSVK